MNGPDAKQERVSRALSLIEQLAKLVVSRPDSMKLQADIGTALVRLSFVSHRDDVGKLLGRGGEHLSQFKFLLMSMLEGTGMSGVIDEVTPLVNGAVWGPLKQTTGSWPKSAVVALLGDIARACYPDVRSVVSVREAERKTRIDAVFEYEVENRKDFAEAVGLLFLAAGRAAGRKLVVDAKVATAADLARMAQAKGVAV